MADLAYKNQNFVFASKGIHSRFTDDQVPEGMWENLDNAEELAETSLGPRLGTSIVNRVGNAVNALSGLVHSVAKLTSLNGNAYRYAASGGNLYRRSGLTQGPYTLISSTLSGNPWQWQADQPSDVTAFPYAFFADANGMLKDNGTLRRASADGDISAAVSRLSTSSKSPDYPGRPVHGAINRLRVHRYLRRDKHHSRQHDGFERCHPRIRRYGGGRRHTDWVV